MHIAAATGRGIYPKAVLKSGDKHLRPGTIAGSAGACVIYRTKIKRFCTNYLLSWLQCD